jgi:Domain of unknown function (DUF1772)
LVGGNIYISGIFIPQMRSISTATDRISNFCAHFDVSKRIYVSLLALGTIAYGTAAYYAPTDRLQQLMGINAVITLGVLPFTFFAIIPTVQKIYALNSGGDIAKTNAEGDKLIEKWGTLSTVRLGIVVVPLLIALREISEVPWY